MLELSSRLLENNLSSEHVLDVSGLDSKESSRSQQMIDRSPLKMDTDASQLLQTLQARFSYTDESVATPDTTSISNEIELLIEEQVNLRTQTLFRQANYDNLTHLPNRAYFNTTLESLIIDANQSQGEFTLLFLDLDGFKKINDTFGHHAGDELLRNVSARVISAVRDGDIVSRLGGDEFVVLLAGELAREDVEGICARIISEVRRPYWIDQSDIQISTSIGVARYPMDATSSSELVEKSDKALYASKDSGRNTYRFYSDLLACEINSDCNPLDRLEKALTQDEIKVCFEPKMDFENQKIVGASVTALWTESRADSPYLKDWMNVLNQSRWAASTGAWLMDSGLYYLQQWQALNDELVVSIPVIPALCQAENMVDFMDARLVEYQVSAAQIQLEFSLETLNDTAVSEQLTALSNAGYQISLTDVGKAPFDLALLSEFDLQTMTLDAKWLQKSLSSVTGTKWLQAIIQMATVLNTSVVATGIDSEQAMEALKTMGCTLGQGTLWAQPLEADGFYQAIRAQLPAMH